MKYRVHIREVMEPYYQKEWHEDFDTLKDAQDRISFINNEIVWQGDWYMQAKEMVEVIE